MNYFGIDLETFSSEDIKTKGLYKYTRSPDFEILLFGGKRNDNKAEQYDLATGEKLPPDVFEILLSPDWIKTSHNAPFEIESIETHFGITLDRSQWQCTQVKGAMLGFPLSLDALAKALRLPLEKNASGKGLIKMFSCPVKPTKVNGMKSRIFPSDNLPKWEKYKRYNIDDVEVEYLARTTLDKYEYSISSFEQKLWRLDQKINSYGVNLDIDLIKNAIDLDKHNKEILTAEAIAITGLENPNSVKQLTAWLNAEDVGEDEITSLKADNVTELLKLVNPAHVKRMLELRQELSKTSINKYKKMLIYACDDGKARGTLQYYGANRTGRFAGRGPQVHNFPKNNIKPLEIARQMIVNGQGELIDNIFGSISYTLSQCLRTALIPSRGCIFGVSDYAAIEARVIAYLSGEEWRMQVFRGDGRIYEASASKMFNIPIEQITKGSPYRSKGKVAELALGFQGSEDALIRMGALEMGIREDELLGLVKAWRRANPAIVKYWTTVNDAAMHSIRFPGKKVSIGKGIYFLTTGDMLYIRLPSGRRLSYVRPCIGTNRFGFDGIFYQGMNQVSKVWGRQDTYGGKLVENIVQAIARDILATAMLRLDKAGYNIPFHVHDEVIVDLPYDPESNADELTVQHLLSDITRLMEIPMVWAPDLPLKAEGFISTYYKKED